MSIDWPGTETIRVNANQIQFEVFTMGRGDRLALCLHGFPEHAFCWRFQMPVLARLGYRVWAPNLRGYGGTDSPAGIQAYQIETLVADVAGLIEASGARETVLIGHDWGGMLAWIVAMLHPRLVQRLVIVNVPHPARFTAEFQRPAQLLKSWYMLLFQIPWLPEFLLGLGGGWVLARLFRRTSRERSWHTADVMSVYRRNAARPGGLTAMVNWYRALLRGGGLKRSSAKGCPKVLAPTLFLWGDADWFFTPLVASGTEAYVSDLTMRVLPGVSHWAQQEAPEAVNAMVEAWLSGSAVPSYSGAVQGR